MKRVLGTEVHDLGEADGPALLCSDLHVPIDGGPVTGRLCALLEHAAALRARLFVLGDLFDSYVCPAQLSVGVYREVAAELRAAVDAGVTLVVLHGNRDFLLGAEFERATGGRVVPGGVRCRLGGRTALLLHGDELCQHDLPYQRAKRWLRRPWVRALARRLPLRAALWVAERARRRSGRVTAAGDPARFRPTAAAVGEAFASGCEVLVFGHVHRAARGRFGAPAAGGGRGEGEYVVLPAFDRDGTGLRADGGSLAFARVDAGRGCVAEPDPPAAEFG